MSGNVFAGSVLTCRGMSGNVGDHVMLYISVSKTLYVHMSGTCRGMSGSVIYRLFETACLGFRL